MSLFALLPALTASAQSNCAYADIRVEATITFDENAVCDAAKQLDDAGYFVLIYVTDFEPRNEDEWFSRLDDVEIDAGIRSGNGGFQRNAIALETAITTDANWAHSLTAGDGLVGTELDTDNGAARVKQPLINAANGGDTSAALVQALGISAELAGTSTGSNSGQTATDSGGSGVGGLLAVVAGVGALGAAGAVAYPRYQKSQAKKREEEGRLAHLASIQERIANLLLGMEQLIDGNTPEESVLYQLFEVYNGHNYPELNDKVTGLIRESQSALTDIFATRSKLLEEDVITSRGTEQLVADWERIYVTMTGSQERILTLSDQELHTLLDPLLVLEKKPTNSKLAGQLDKLKQSLDGVPLKVQLETIDPSSMDEAGILGNIDAIQAEIGRLQDAQDEAPNRLEAAQRERLEADKGDADAPFVVAEADRFGGIDQRLNNAESLIIEGLHLRAIEELELAEDLADVLQDLKQAESLWDKRQAEIAAIEADGFHAPATAAMRREIETDLAELSAALRAGEPDDAIDWGVEFDADGKEALAAAQAWRDLHHNNQQRLATLNAEFTAAAEQDTASAANAWRALQAYPNENWSDLAQDYQTDLATLEQVPSQLDAIKTHNTLETQQFDRAESDLTALEAEVEGMRVTLAAVANRIDEVVSAEKNIDAAILQAKKALQEAVALRDSEDSKVDEGVDAQISSARAQLADAEQKRSERSFILAIHAQSHSYELATDAYKSANEQIETINALQHQVNEFIDTRYDSIERQLRQANERDNYLLSKETLNGVRTAVDQLSKGLQRYHAAEAQEDTAMANSLRSALEQLEAADNATESLMQAVRDEEKRYNATLNSAEKAVMNAEKAIASAFSAGGAMGTGNNWQRLAEKAQKRVPQTPTRGMSLQKLAKIEREANDAREIAQSAEDSAEKSRRAYQRRQMERQMRRTVVRPSYGGGSSWGNTGSGWGSIGGSSSRRSGSSSSRRSMPSFGGGGSSFGGSSRRGGSSFGGSSRRGGSMGGSRRR